MSGEYCKTGCVLGECELKALAATVALAGELLAEQPSDATPPEVYKGRLETLLSGHAKLLDRCTSYAATDALHIDDGDELPPVA
jgi:hypothetical protein